MLVICHSLSDAIADAVVSAMLGWALARLAVVSWASEEDDEERFSGRLKPEHTHAQRAARGI